VQALLAAGAALGLALAAVGIMRPAGDRTDALPVGAVARVGDVLIRSDDYERLLAGLESDSRSPIDAEKRRFVLDRMIDEELLVQRALELGLARVDRRVRADLTSSLIASIVSEADAHEPTESELREYYDQNRDFFTHPGRLRVQQIFFRVPMASDEDAARARAEGAREALAAGETFEAVRAHLGDAEISPLPDALLPATKLREYVGPTALRTAMELAPGAVSEPVRSGSGIHLLRLVQREDAATPPFEEIESQVRSEWRRRAGDRALRRYLDELRENQEVVTAEGL
jgi:parvulin-like peptidyl-prolyl isomerase